MSDQEQTTDIPPRMLSSVWVKIEVDEDGVVEGIEGGDNLAEQSDSPDETPVKQARKTNWTKRKRSPGQSLLCELCDYSTRHYALLQRHIIGQHQAKDKSDDLIVYKCPLCPYESIFKANYTAHKKRRHTAEKNFKCELCDYKTSYRNNIVKHAKVHRKKEEHIYQCDKCTFFTKFEGHIARHLAVMHSEVSDKATKCDTCNFATKVRWRLKAHINKSHQEKPINCQSCDFSTMFMCEFKMHKAAHRVDAIKSDDKITPALDSNYQEKLIKKKTPTQCDNSNQYIIDTEFEVDWKSIPVTELPGLERLFKCTMCDYSSKFKASVQRHYYRLHTDSKKPYKCINCDYSTKTKDKIVLHTKRSQSTTELECTNCDFKTYYKCQQVMHQKSHNQFKCDFCKYTCNNSWNVERHVSSMHQNTGIKCKFCEYRAARKDSLLCHEATHTGIQPFKCEECDYSCTRRHTLENHLKRRHHKKNQAIVYISDNKFEQLKVDPKCSGSESK